ncbi:alkaline phosphatase family protein [Hungatella hathewayi]|nr:alkaline phosphatase family protein [Hungatella hathewayi]MBS4983075.1 alkaline phosphatase family protein [Hungatella hathewayi]
MNIVFILSDALRHDYIEHMPYLKKMSEENIYYENVKPGIGFCEISEYITGIDSIENGNLFQLTFNRKFGKKKFKLLTYINEFFNHIPRIRRYTQKLITKILEKKDCFIDRDILRVRYNIPINLLSYFEPTESRYQYDSEQFFPNTNLLLQIKALGKTYDIDDFVKHNKIKGTDEERLKRLNAKIKNKELSDFTLLYIGKGEFAHMTGTSDSKFHNRLAEYDDMLKNLNLLLKENYNNNYRLIILGDHGMVDVKKYINILPVVKKIKSKYGLSVGDDFVYFIDSTALRLWFKDKKIIPQVDNDISKYLEGNIELTKIDNKYYGDLIYMLKPSNVFFPDFFNTKKNKGMHGYNNTIHEQKGLCVIMGSKTDETYKEIPLHEVKHIVLDLLK